MRFTVSEIKGFTLVEMLVSIAIFVLITTVVVFRHASFNASVQLSNAVYDLALQFRQSQFEAVNVTTEKYVVTGGSAFQITANTAGRGLAFINFTGFKQSKTLPFYDFRLSISPALGDINTLDVYATDGVCNDCFHNINTPVNNGANYELILDKVTNLPPGIVVNNWCVVSTTNVTTCDTSFGTSGLYVSYLRPSTKANIYVASLGGSSPSFTLSSRYNNTSYATARICLANQDDLTKVRVLQVSQSGQITIVSGLQNSSVCTTAGYSALAY
jgi:prepilin-type N-terminal cleavage/methylation domain-containing protein